MCRNTASCPAVDRRTPNNDPRPDIVAAGVDITVIRSWLGHVSLDTTNHYARANLETKRRALERVDRSTRPGKPLRWKPNPDLLNWLDSL